MIRTAFIAGLFACTLAGCAEEDFGTVQGTVTMDGEPAADVTVTLRPIDGRRESLGVTDSQGRFELHYSLQRMGAWVGEHSVTLSTLVVAPAGGKVRITEEETIPSRYNVDSEITATIEPGENQLDFSLTSDGEIRLPSFFDPVPIEFEDDADETPHASQDEGSLDDPLGGHPE